MDDHLGGRLRLRTKQELDDDQRQTYDLINDTVIPSLADKVGFKAKLDDGRLIGPFNPFVVSPKIGAAYSRFSEEEVKSSSLDRRTREVVILTVGSVWQSPYELYAHAASGRASGIPDAALEALRTGHGSPELSREEDVARRFVLQLAVEHRVSDELYMEAREAFDEKGLVDIAVLAGEYMITCAVLNTFAIPAPDAAEDG